MFWVTLEYTPHILNFSHSTSDTSLTNSISHYLVNITEGLVLWLADLLKSIMIGYLLEEPKLLLFEGLHMEFFHL